LTRKKRGATVKLDVRAVRVRMAEQGIDTLSELAARLDLSKNATSALLSGKSAPSLDTIGRLCEVLDCTPNDILRLAAEKAG
jgi:DNA-binding Xre family transcriptional regulator